MHVTSGAVETCRFENVCIPEQPLKLCPTESAVRISSEDTLNVMTMPCAVVPFHWPTLSDEGDDGDVGSVPHAEASSPASVPTHKSAFVRVAIVTLPGTLLHPIHTGRVLRVQFRPADDAGDSGFELSSSGVELGYPQIRNILHSRCLTSALQPRRSAARMMPQRSAAVGCMRWLGSRVPDGVFEMNDPDL